MKSLILLFALSLSVGAQTANKINGITVGTSAGNVSKWNGITIGGSAGNVSTLNGISLPAGTNTPALVGTQPTNGCGSGVTTCAVTKTIAAGNLIIACTDGANNQAVASGGITDTKSLSWSDVASNARTTVAFLRCWSAPTGVNSGSTTFIAHFLPSTSSPDVWVIEVTGLVSKALDKVTSANGNGTTCAPGTTAAITGGQTEFIWASCTTDSSSTFTADSGGGYSSIASLTNAFFINENKNASSGTQTTSISMTGGSGSWVGMIAAFK